MVLLFASVILIHAAYSVTEWRSLTRTSSTSGAGDAKSGADAENKDQRYEVQKSFDCNFVPLKQMYRNTFGKLNYDVYLIHRTHQHGGEQTIPLDITIQTIFGFVLAMFSVLQIAGDFKEIRAGIEMGKKTWENARNRPSFYVYNHRGKAFSPHYDPTCANQQITDSRRPLMNIPQRFLS